MLTALQGTKLLTAYFCDLYAFRTALQTATATVCSREVLLVQSREETLSAVVGWVRALALV